MLNEAKFWPKIANLEHRKIDVSLTDGTPALRIALAHLLTSAAYFIRMKTLKNLKKTFSLDEWMKFHRGMLPWHYACRAGAPCPALQWCWQQYPEAIRITTIFTEDTLLHYYFVLFISTTALEKDSANVYEWYRSTILGKTIPGSTVQS